MVVPCKTTILTVKVIADIPGSKTSPFSAIFVRWQFFGIHWKYENNKNEENEDENLHSLIIYQLPCITNTSEFTI